jgi:Fic family protein
MNTKAIEQLAKEYMRLSSGIVDFKKYTWYSITHHSTSIEGSTLTGSQVINLLEYGKPAPKKPFEHHLMVSDYFNAMSFAMDQAEEKRPLSTEFIKEIGALVMKNTGGEINAMAGNYNTSKGEFRKSTVRAGTRIFPDYKKVPLMVETLCDQTNKAVKKASTFEQKNSLSFELHFNLVSIHPFGDGNGRTSRLLMNYIQSFLGLPLSVVFKSDRIGYIDALELARKQENTEPFYRFMYGQYSKFLKHEINTLKK